MGKKNNLQKLSTFTSYLKKDHVLSSNEAITSHIFISYLYYFFNVKPYQLIPQGHNKTGPVDYIYFPKNPKFNDVNIYIEVKAYGRIKQNSEMKQLKGYMKGALPKEVKNLNRKNNWSIGLYTDMRSLNIIFRKLEKNKKTTYFLALKDFICDDHDSFFKNEDLKAIFSDKFNPINYISQKIWEDPNRYKIVRKVIDENKRELYNKIQDKWKKKICGNKKDWRKRFKKTLGLALKEWKVKNEKLLYVDDEYQNYVNSIKQIINEKNIRKAIIKKINGYGFSVKVSKKIFF